MRVDHTANGWVLVFRATQRDNAQMHARWRSPGWCLLSLVLVACTHGATETVLTVDFPSAGVVPGGVVVLESNEQLASTPPTATLAGNDQALARIDDFHLGFVLPAVDPGTTKLTVSGFPTIELETLAAPSISDPVGFTNQIVANANTELTTLAGKSAATSAYVTDAQQRLTAFQTQFGSASSDQQLAIATELAANPDLITGITSATTFLDFAIWTNDATTFLTDYSSFCGGLLLLQTATTPLQVVAGTFIATAGYAKLEVDHGSLIADHIVVDPDGVTADDDPLAFTNQADVALAVTLDLRSVTADDVDSSNPTIRRVAEVEGSLADAVEFANMYISPALQPPADDDSGESRAPLTSEITISSDHDDVQVMLTSGGAAPALVSTTASGCEPSSTASLDFHLTVNYVGIPDQQVTATMPAHVDCDACLGPSAETTFANPTDIDSTGNITPTNCTDDTIVALPCDSEAVFSPALSQIEINIDGTIAGGSDDGGYDAEACTASYELTGSFSEVGTTTTCDVDLVRDDSGPHLELSCTTVPAACTASGCQCGTGMCMQTYSL